jgi:glycosyltransferase involved in cell wall biosynthesis
VPESLALSTTLAGAAAGRAASPVAVFLASLDAGGAERAMLGLISGLAAAGRPVELVLARARGPLLAEVPPTIPVVDLGARRTVAALPRLIQYLRTRRPAALVGTLMHTNFVAVGARQLARRRTRLVLVEQSIPALAAQSPLRRDRWAVHAIRWLYPWADAVVAVSEGVARELRRVAPGVAPRLHVVPNLVVTPAVWERARAPLRHPWLQPGAPPVILSVARLAAEKNLPALLDAVAMLRRRRAVRLVVLGEGPARPQLAAHAAALGITADVDLAGFDPNPYRYMTRASVLALSSRVEGLPTVLIEALALGTPVVATDCESGPREILRDGRFGRLVPVGDVAALADALAATLDAERLPVPEAAWLPYTAAAVIPRYVDILGLTPTLRP